MKTLKDKIIKNLENLMEKAYKNNLSMSSLYGIAEYRFENKTLINTKTEINILSKKRKL